MFEFQEWPKIPRYKRNVCVSEKIDGTNGQIAIFEVSPLDRKAAFDAGAVVAAGKFVLFAGSRNRWLQPEVLKKGGDNFGFAQWVVDNAPALAELGPGRHYGEWWGAGIGRRYGLTEKRFSLFNTARWGAHNPPPACCGIVPVLYQGTPDRINEVLDNLRKMGSSAAPGFMNPEGVIVYHCDSRQYYKITLENDGVPKSQVVQTGNVVGGDLAGGDIYKCTERFLSEAESLRAVDPRPIGRSPTLAADFEKSYAEKQWPSTPPQAAFDRTYEQNAARRGQYDGLVADPAEPFGSDSLGG